MRGCNPTPTQADRVRFDLLQRLGCIVCRLNGHPSERCEIHHIKQGDHQYTLGLCAWHHRGEPRLGLSPSACEIVLGPSLARAKRYFVVTYGSELELLAYTNRLLLEMQ